MEVATLGYEGLSMERFAEALRQHGIQTVVDVRDLPLSRKVGFSKTPLERALRELGIRYIHAKALGCPKPIRDAYRRDPNWARYAVAFETYLETRSHEMLDLAQAARQRRCCLVCFEADANRCHRSLVAEHLRTLVPDVQIVHLH